jgi:hypothetical protein
MYGLPKDLDLSFFVGKRLDQVSFAQYVIFFFFDDKISITLESSFQHQTRQEVENLRLGVMQSVPVTHSTLMQLVGHSVVSVSADDEGTLNLTFDDGQVLGCIEHRSPYESYNFTDGEHLYIV